MPLGTFSKLPRESLRALYYKLGGTDDISDLRTRRALLKKIYEAMGNDSADLDNMHRANSVLQKISEVASVGGKYVGVDISDGELALPNKANSNENPLILSSRATAEINAVLSAGKTPIAELDPTVLYEDPDPTITSIYGIFAKMALASQGWRAVIQLFIQCSDGTISPRPDPMFCQSFDYSEVVPPTPTPGGKI